MSQQDALAEQKKNCIFCRIIAGEIPSTEIYSDGKVKVILDINPANEGHLIVLPKEHYQILPQIPDDLIGYMFVIAKRASKSLLKGLGVQGTSIFVANGAIAGQKAPHFMLHVVPRKKGDMLFGIEKTNVDAAILKEARLKLASRLEALTGRKLNFAVKENAKPVPVITEEKKMVQAPLEKGNSAESANNGGSGSKSNSGETTDKDNGKKGDMDLDSISNLFI